MTNVIDRKRLKFKDGYTYLGRNMIMDEHPEHIHKSLLEYFFSSTPKDILAFSNFKRPIYGFYCVFLS